MRTTTTLFACPLLRPFGVAGEHRLGVSVLSAWTLDGAPLAAQELWPRFGRAAGGDTVLDQGIPKSASEYLLVGHAHAGEPVAHLPVAVEIGGRRKVLHVVGDRAWRRGVPTEPRPFTKMPLSWSHAFGGEGFAENPLGKGFASGDPEGVALPNVELPGRMIRSPGERPPPAGFGAFGIDWPQRTRGLGTYDQAWLERDFPGFARDIDWRVHNVAPEDQRFEEPFAPGQRIVLHNLVEGRPLVELTLPRVAARCFTYRDEEARDLSEVPLALRTLWLVPDEDMIVLVFHGSEAVSSMLASEVRGILCALDDPDRPRDVEHFGRALARRLDRELGAAEMLDDRPLMPEGMAFPDFQTRAEDLTLPERRGALAANLYAGAELRRQEALRLFAEAGFEGGEELFPPQAPPAPSNAPLTEQIREAFAEAERQRAAAEEKTAAMRAEATAELEKLGFDPSVLEKPHVGPPPILAAQHLAMLEEVVRDARAAGVPMEAFERQLEDPDYHRELLEKEAMGRQAYRLSAHHTEGAPEVDVDRRDAVRAFVEAAIRERSSLARADLTAADLAELDLSGMDLTGAWLEGANLQKANLSHARLDSAVLAKADLSEAVLSGTSLRRASLGKARLLWTAVDRCDLEEAILASADLRGARFSRSSLAGADLSDVRLEQTSFAECDLGAVTFLRMSLADTVFSACKLEECNFVEVCLDRTSLTRCRLAKSVFVTCTGEGTVLYEADLENARFVSGCVFEECDFRRARMPRSTLRGGRFARSFFDEADLSESDVSQGAFSDARFYRADLRRALATECDLREAMMAGANLMLAVLQGSDIRGADLRGTNLFGADLALVHADRATSLEGALVKRARHRPLRREAS